MKNEASPPTADTVAADVEAVAVAADVEAVAVVAIEVVAVDVIVDRSEVVAVVVEEAVFKGLLSEEACLLRIDSIFSLFTLISIIKANSRTHLHNIGVANA